MCKVNARGTYEYRKALHWALVWSIHYQDELERLDKKQRSRAEIKK